MKNASSATTAMTAMACNSRRTKNAIIAEFRCALNYEVKNRCAATAKTVAAPGTLSAVSF